MSFTMGLVAFVVRLKGQFLEAFIASCVLTLVGALIRQDKFK